MKMTSSLELISIQYALALLVGKDLDLRTMLRKFIPPALRLLNCRSGYVWLRACEATSANHFKPCYSYPLLKAPLAEKIPSVVIHLQQLVDNNWRLAKPLKIQNTDGSNSHFLPIGTSGALMLVRDQPLLDSELLALEPVLLRLETACKACVQHAYVEQARNEALQAKEAAELANKAKSGFLAMISHELRTPMNSIIGLTDLMLYSDATTSQREYLGLIKSSTNALLDIINEILDFARIEAGALTLSNAPFQLRNLLRNTFAPLAIRAQEKSLTFQWNIEPQIPDILEGDENHLRQVLTNLVNNAIKFTESGEVTVNVTQQSTTTDGFANLYFAVRDTGVGIPPEKQASIFQPFEQIHTAASSRYGGSGLGLAISTRLVQLMGGSLQVDSTSGQGSLFYFTLDFKQAAETTSPSLARPGLAATTHPLKILLAEDNGINSMFTALLLNKVGHTVTVVEDGHTAVNAWLKNRPDIILMDMQMPRMNGLEATRLIRQHEQASNTHTPIIALTANAMKNNREECLASGMDDFLSKPFEARDLLALLEQVGEGCRTFGQVGR